MSAEMIGADLEQLDELSIAFRAAGEEFSNRAATLRSHVGVAITAFETTLERLARRTNGLTDDMRTEIAEVASTAETVAWTGANRTAFDGDLGAFRQAVDAGAAGLDDGISRLRAHVGSRFTPVMDEFGAIVVSSAGRADEDATAMNEAIASQRASLEQAANVGWTSA